MGADATAEGDKDSEPDFLLCVSSSPQLGRWGIALVNFSMAVQNDSHKERKGRRLTGFSSHFSPSEASVLAPGHVGRMWLQEPGSPTSW